MNEIDELLDDYQQISNTIITANNDEGNVISESTKDFELFKQNEDYPTIEDIANYKKYDYSSESDSRDSGLNVRSVSSESSLESTDPFSNLPENWLSFDFNRKKSCLLTSIYSTCVTKAINHLDSLQNAIESWMKKIERALPDSSDNSATDSAKELMNLVRKRNDLATRRTEMKHVSNFTMDKNNLSESDPSFSGDQQLVLYTNDGGSKSSDVISKEHAMSVDEDLNIGGILEEILMLLARLEYDRRRTQMLLAHEHQNFGKLKSCVENLALKRAVELPVKVQREHDACVNDITELNWHISFNLKVERKLKRKVEIEERLHAQLKEEIANITKNLPLMKEKIDIELEFFDKIESAQNDVKELLNNAKERFLNTQEKSELAYSKAAKEREAIKAELDECRRSLNKAKKRLQDAKDQHVSYLERLRLANEKIAENMMLEKIEIEKKLQQRSRLNKLNDENADALEETARMIKEIEKKKEANNAKAEVINNLAKQYQEEIDALVEILNAKVDKMEKILKKVKEKEVDIEEMNKDKKSIEKHLVKDERNKQRLIEEKLKCDEQLTKLLINLDKVIKVHELTKGEHETEMKRIGGKEDIIKKQMAEIKKQLNEERFKLSTIISKLGGENEDFKRNSEEYNTQKKLFERKKTEIDQRLAELKKKVDGVEDTNSETSRRVEILTKQLREMRENHVKLEADLKKKLETKEPLCQSKMEQHMKTKSRLDFVKADTIEKNKKIADMEESKQQMLKTIEKLNKEIAVLIDIQIESQKQCDATAILDRTNKTSLDDVTNRINESKRNHDEYMSTRNDFLNKLESQQTDYMDLNRQLASRYRDLKYDLFDVKMNLLGKIEAKLGTYVSLKDKREVKLLQSRMHYALKAYFDYQILSSEKSTFDLRVRRQKLGDKIETIETTLIDSVNNVTEFLNNQIDFSLVRQQAMEKVYKEELIEKQNEEMKANSGKSSKLSKTNGAVGKPASSVVKFNKNIEIRS